MSPFPPDARVLATACANVTESLMITDAPADAAADGPRIVYVNDAFTALTGYQADQVLGRNPRFLQCPDTDRGALDVLGAAVRELSPAEVDLLNVRADGSRFWVHLGISPVTDGSGHPTNWVGVQREVTDRRPAAKPADRQVRSALDQRSSAFGDAPIGMAITDPRGVLLQVNAELQVVLGRTESELLGTDLFSRTHPDDLAAAQAACAALREGRQTRVQVDCRLRHSAGHYLYAQVTTSRVDDPSGGPGHLVMHVQDTSEQAGLQAEMTRRALHDGLTGLPNRTLFLDRLTQAIGRARRDRSQFALLFCDLDDFKAVNDSLGHAAGDQVLATVAARLQSMLRPGDTAARLGGDEFTALCEHTDLAGARRIADRLEAAISAPISCGDDIVRLTVSTGLVIGGRDDDGDAAVLLRNADTAMYSAKGGGRARHVAYDPGMHRDAATRRRVETALQDAIDVEQFELWYQPVVDLASGSVQAVEALLRWRHPSRGLLLPAEFLRVAEDSGLVLPIGAWVLDRAAAQARQWLDRPPPDAPVGHGVVWVNVSARQLNAELLGDLERAVTRHRLPPGAIGIELTESVLMDDLPVVRPLLEQITGLGVRLAIDDFGTGYSSLSHLAALPVDVVKVDRSFTAQLTAGGSGAAVVSAVLALATALGMQTIVEGVETAGQLRLLRELGVPAVQGHHLARPAPAPACAQPGSALLPT